MRLKKCILYAAALGAGVVGFNTGAFSQTAAPYYTESDRAAMGRHQAYSDLTTGSIPRGPTLGRFTKTPDGNFNTTRSLLDGTSSGDGSGPGGGSPNGG